MNKLVFALAVAGVLSAPTAVVAADASPHSLTANVGLTSNYIFRGISQTGGDPAIQGGLDYSHSSGVYVGTWASNVGWLEDYQGYTSGNVEIDVYGGFRNKIGDTGLAYDVGVIQYAYPGKKGSVTKADTSEIYASLGWKWFTAKYSYYVSDEVFGFANADGSDYFDISASVPIADTGLTAGAHWGSFKFKNNGDQDYEDWKISLAYDMGKLGSLGTGVTVGVAYTDTNAKRSKWTDTNNEFLGKDTTTVWISRSF
ncbi:MAG: TorF family putative porin [Gammaproteobacteria bacterium]